MYLGQIVSKAPFMSRNTARHCLFLSKFCSMKFTVFDMALSVHFPLWNPCCCMLSGLVSKVSSVFHTHSFSRAFNK